MGVKHGNPVDSQVENSGSPPAILGVRMPGLPLILYTAWGHFQMCGSNVLLMHLHVYNKHCKDEYKHIIILKYNLPLLKHKSKWKWNGDFNIHSTDSMYILLLLTDSNNLKAFASEYMKYNQVYIIYNTLWSSRYRRSIHFCVRPVTLCLQCLVNVKVFIIISNTFLENISNYLCTHLHNCNAIIVNRL